MQQLTSQQHDNSSSHIRLKTFLLIFKKAKYNKKNQITNNIRKRTAGGRRNNNVEHSMNLNKKNIQAAKERNKKKHTQLRTI